MKASSALELAPESDRMFAQMLLSFLICLPFQKRFKSTEMLQG